MKLSTILLASCAFTAVASAASAHEVLPQGGAFVAGHGTITTAGHDLTVNQSTARGVVDWHSFNIGQQNSVDIVNHGGATLNRVTGSDMSTIAGRLHSDGTVFLINKNGVVIDRTGSVITNGSFVASTRDADNAAFMSGNQHLSGNNSAGVVNKGTISAGKDAILIGHSVNNFGTITAKRVAALASADAVTLAETGDIAVTQRTSEKGNVTNSGRIKAAEARLSAENGNIYALAADHDSSADSSIEADGGVYLTASDDISVSDTSIKAGNKIQVGSAETRSLSVTNTRLSTAKKGSIETSAHHVSVKSTTVDAKGGTWLTDPDDLDIDSDAAQTIESALNAGTDVTQTTSAGAGAGAGDIVVNADITYTSNAKLTLSSYHSVLLNSDINVNGGGTVNITTSNGGTDRTAGGHINFAKSTGGALNINGNAYTLLYSASDLQKMQQQRQVADNNYFALANDVDLSNVSFAPVTNMANGRFDGLGHVVANMTLTDNQYNPLGFFATNAMFIANFGIENGNITSNGNSGLIAAEQQNSADNVWSTGSVVGSNSVGGIFGRQVEWDANKHTLSASYSTATVAGSTAGGLVGQGWIVSDSYHTGNVTGKAFAGGIAGLLNDGGTMPASVTNAYTSGTIEGAGGDAGGIIGGSTGKTVSLVNVSSDADVSGAYAGGLAGVLSATNSSIQNSYADGAITSKSKAGGLVGQNQGNLTITDAYAAGDVTQSGASGGFAGGLVGQNQCTLTASNAYSYNPVSADPDSSVDGIAVNSGAGTTALTNVYYNSDVSSTSTTATGLGYNTFSTAKLDDKYTSFANRPILKDYDYVTISGSEHGVYGNAQIQKSSIKAVNSDNDDVTTQFADVTLRAPVDSKNNAGQYTEIGGINGRGGSQIVYNATLTIDPASLTVAANDVRSTYGMMPVVNGYTVSGLVNGDSVSGVDLTTGATAKSGVGSYGISAKNAQGTGLSNYNVTYKSGTLTIDPAALTIAASDNRSTYGVAPVVSGYTVAGLVNGDSVNSVDLNTAATAKSNVGSYVIAASNAKGVGLNNYNVTYKSGTLTIDPAVLTVTAADGRSTYGMMPVVNGYTVSGLVNNDSVSSVDLMTAATAKSSVGSYEIAASGAQGVGLSNYNISYKNGTLTIDPAALTVSASDSRSVYGSSPVVNGYTVDGLVNGDSVNSVDLSTAANSKSNVGNYEIVAKGASGVGLSNYNVTYKSGTLTIDPASLTVTANDNRSVYGVAPVVGGYTVAGLVNNDSVSGVNLTTGATAKSNVGSYEIASSGAKGTGLNNYNISYKNGTLTIDPASLTIIAQDQKGQAGSYVLDKSAYKTTGLLNNDSVSSVDLSTTATEKSGAGAYAIDAAGAAGSGLSNYSIVYKNGTLTLDAAPKPEPKPTDPVTPVPDPVTPVPDPVTPVVPVTPVTPVTPVDPVTPVTPDPVTPVVPTPAPTPAPAPATGWQKWVSGAVLKLNETISSVRKSAKSTCSVVQKKDSSTISCSEDK